MRLEFPFEDGPPAILLPNRLVDHEEVSRGFRIPERLGTIAQASQKDPFFYFDKYRPDVQVGMEAAILRRYRHDPSGQLSSVEDSRRGRVEYRYDPVGRLLAANSALGHETFAFDPAGNIQATDTAQQKTITRRVSLPKLLDNLLKEYAGVSYRYDQRCPRLFDQCARHDDTCSSSIYQAHDISTRLTGSCAQSSSLAFQANWHRHASLPSEHSPRNI